MPARLKPGRGRHKNRAVCVRKIEAMKRGGARIGLRIRHFPSADGKKSILIKHAMFEFNGRRIAEYWVTGRFKYLGNPHATVYSESFREAYLLAVHEATLIARGIAPKRDIGINQLRLFRDAMRRAPTKYEGEFAARLARDAIQFTQQHVIGFYIADFLIPSKLAVIEIDGASHDSASRQYHDARRTQFLEAAGFCVIRIRNGDVKSFAMSRITDLPEHQLQDVNAAFGRTASIKHAILKGSKARRGAAAMIAVTDLSGSLRRKSNRANQP